MMRKRVTVQDCPWVHDDLMGIQEDERIHEEWQRKASVTREKARQYRQKKKDRLERLSCYLKLACRIACEPFTKPPTFKQLTKDTIEYDALCMAVLSGLDGLTRVERKVIVLRFGLLNGKVLTLDETGSHIRSRHPDAPKEGVVKVVVKYYDGYDHIGDQPKFVEKVQTIGPTITKERVRQIEAKALRKLRRPSRGGRAILFCVTRLRLGRLNEGLI